LSWKPIPKITTVKTIIGGKEAAKQKSKLYKLKRTFFSKKFKKHSKADSNYGSNYSSNSSVTNNHYDFKRRRFNSDGASENVIENQQKQNTRITMSNQIKFRYSIREMKDIIMLNYNYFEQKPNFVNEIEEICSNVQRKKINILGELDSKRDRSNTINYQAYEFKNKFNESKKSFNIPKNNRTFHII